MTLEDAGPPYFGGSDDRPTCGVLLCSDAPILNGDYCLKHTCSEIGCTNRTAWDSSHCTDHSADVHLI